MRAFWRFMQHSSKAEFAGRLLKDRVGNELAQALRQERIVVPAAGHYDDWQSRHCGDGDMLHLSVEHLVDLLRRHLPVVVAGTDSVGKPKSVEHAVEVGTMVVEGAPTEVFLALQPVSESFPWFIAQRRLGPNRTWVLVPTDEVLPAEFTPLCGQDERVQIVYLDEILSLRHGRIVASTASISREAFCTVTDHSGHRQVTRPHYLSILDAADTYNLLVDWTTPVEGGLYRAVASMDGMLPRISGVSGNQAAAMTELVIARRPMRVDELTSVKVERPGKLIERARSLVDFELSRREWRAFKTLPADSRRDKRFFFDPPADFRFAFLYL